MSLEIVSTLAAVGTFIVIAATAIAAIVQLRHMRASNQLEGLLVVLKELESEKVNRWVTQTQHELPKMMNDPAYVQSIIDESFDRNVAWLQLANEYERVGSLLKYNLIPEELFLDVYWGRAVQAWNLMLPLTSLARSAMGNAVWENFEYIYIRAKAFRDRYPDGNYPHGVPRAEVPPFRSTHVA